MELEMPYLKWNGPVDLGSKTFKSLPDSAGLYFLSLSDKKPLIDAETGLPDLFLAEDPGARPQYVGQSQSLRRRIQQHVTNLKRETSSNDLKLALLHVYWAETNQARSLERILVNAAFNIILRTRQNRFDLQKVYEVLLQAQNRSISPEDTAAAIEERAPTMALLCRLLIPKSAADFYGMLAVVLAVVFYLLQHSDESITRTPEIVVQQVVQQNFFLESFDASNVYHATTPKSNMAHYHEGE